MRNNPNKHPSFSQIYKETESQMFPFGKGTERALILRCFRCFAFSAGEGERQQWEG